VIAVLDAVVLRCLPPVRGGVEAMLERDSKSSEKTCRKIKLIERWTAFEIRLPTKALESPGYINTLTAIEEEISRLCQFHSTRLAI
jgi:hypothetical protein